MPDAAPRVLIVEDDGDIRSLFEVGLASRGYVIESAPNGREALAIIASGSRPSVIIADLHMPVMDGWQLLTALAGDPALAAIPVIVLTAADDPSKLAPRPATILIKPVSLDRLAAAISAAVGSR